MLARYLEGFQVRFEQEKCLRVKYPAYACDKCAKSCQFEAITSSGRVEFNEDKCRGCGLCAGVCPTDAFSLSRPSYFQLMQEAFEKRNITLTCRHNPASGGPSLPCLGYLNTSMLLGFVLCCNSVRIFYSAQMCSGCRLQAGTLVEKRLNRVMKAASYLGMREVLSISGTVQEARISRRDFFSFFKNGVETLAHDVKKPVSKDNEPGSGKKLVPVSRQHFLEMAGNSQIKLQVGTARGEDWPFAQYEISDQCDGCGNCILFCPTGALELKKFKGEYGITHTAFRCIRCGLCTANCLNQALRQKEFVDISVVAAGLTLLIKKLDRLLCARCGSPKSSGEQNREAEFCDLCEQEYLHRMQSKKLMLSI